MKPSCQSPRVSCSPISGSLGGEYLRHQEEGHNTCHSGQICSLHFQPTLCRRICSECCAACAGPNRQSLGLRSCIPRSCTAEHHKAAPKVERVVTSRSGTPQGVGWGLCLATNIKLKIFIKVHNNNLLLYTFLLITAVAPRIFLFLF